MAIETNRFLLPSGKREAKSYGQYANMYFSRMKQLNFDFALAKCKDLVPDAPACWVAGSVYKTQALKPNVLNELIAHAIADHRPNVGDVEKHTSADDSYALEDETGRVTIRSSDLVTSYGLVTGVIVALFGTLDQEGFFNVRDIGYPQMTRPQPALTPSMEDNWIALTSGLNGGAPDSISLGLHIFFQFISGKLAGLAGAEDLKISQLILAGCSLIPPKRLAFKNENRRFGTDYAPIDTEPLKNVDTMLSSVLNDVRIDMMPGATDPANISFPQQPVNRSLFANAGLYDSLHTVTNPYIFSLADGTTLLGTSGQNIDDIYQNSSIDSRLDIAERTLTWSHIAPTCPDTLWGYPFTGHDPFVLEDRPHVYFIGNQPAFEQRLVVDETTGAKTLVLLIPSFEKTGVFVLLNTRTMEVRPSSLDTSDLDAAMNE
ncbi:MAG: hypothetical protein SGCHY_004106 [Lobulomycetales sp.]